MDASVAVVDEESAERFTYTAHGAEAELVYRRDGRRLVLVHTGVPDELGGRGVGGQLVQAAVAKATAEGLELVPWCPFARRWLEGHTDEVGAVTVDWSPPPSEPHPT